MLERGYCGATVEHLVRRQSDHNPLSVADPRSPMLRVMWCIMLGIRLSIMWSGSSRMIGMFPSASMWITLGIPLLGKSSWKQDSRGFNVL
ncbi:hypothetical protein TSUD_157420 [Trifolium subterraneum]|uniref:Uncharacterized protein n=1 Tax=Trifolium subterraneum TaxID=3900 RepID=A0A2Z6MMK4_TRISU|nr:hypothetical protein TSUD_157420 [Trifolium subterraneum]